MPEREPSDEAAKYLANLHARNSGSLNALEIIEALGKTGSIIAVDRLKTIAETGGLEQRKAAIKALGEIGQTHRQQ